MKLLLTIFFIICITDFSEAQTEKILTQEQKKQLTKRIRLRNVIQAETYLSNSDIGDITFADQFHPNGRKYILNGNIIPNFNITPRFWPVIAVLNPIVRVRIIENQPSWPVRTPSFMPGLLVHFNPFGKWQSPKFSYLSVGAYHHSNGQDGEPLNPDGSINLVNGNFNDNYALVNFNWGKNSSRKIWYYRTGIEVHSGLFGFMDEPKLRSKLGQLRFNGQISHTWMDVDENDITDEKKSLHSNNYDFQTYTPKLKLLLNAMVVLNKIEGNWSHRFNLEGKIYYNPFLFENTSFFASLGYMGHDYYNIYFNQTYPIVRVGLAAGLPLRPTDKYKRQLRDLTKKPLVKHRNVH